ncbi:Putative FBD-associated F-box protein [Arachis hypogaea]|uniref:FBD-associated F-box protein n=1 Tax=Arachis hypogaea TaxID=3818 RepID=A0A6B9V6T5_ARAHY|nr:Putative FBD-associated F-box protein [Arachis hypogaea]
MDRFSALPKIILHDILVRLPVKDAAKTSVLSKAWNDTWFSFPNLSVCSEDFSLKMMYPQEIDKDDLTHVSHHVDQWIQMACESGVQVLELYLNDDCVRWYELPLCVIEAKSLIELELLGGIKIDQELLKHSMKFSSVKMLFLSRVLFTHESAIEYLILIVLLLNVSSWVLLHINHLSSGQDRKGGIIIPTGFTKAQES